MNEDGFAREHHVGNSLLEWGKNDFGFGFVDGGRSCCDSSGRKSGLDKRNTRDAMQQVLCCFEYLKWGWKLESNWHVLMLF
jgi:hypothetical protein